MVRIKLQYAKGSEIWPVYFYNRVLGLKTRENRFALKESLNLQILALAFKHIRKLACGDIYDFIICV